MKTTAVIGAGFAGLAAAWDLVQKGHQVTVFESTLYPGGLASGIKEKSWQWSLEHHYHHIFQTDQDILRLVKEMGLSDQVFFSNTTTRSFYKDRYWQLDSPISLLHFQPLSLVDRLRVGLVLAFLKIIPNGTFLEKFTAVDFLQKTMGRQAWKILWQPLFVGKFGKSYRHINMAWFWARIKARSQKLGYFQGGFLSLSEKMVNELEKKGVIFHFQTPVKKLVQQKNKIKIATKKANEKPGEKATLFDAVIVTLPSPFFSQISNLPLPKLRGLGAMTLVLELESRFFQDDTYWLNIHHSRWPFLAVVEHTNLTSSQKYGNKHLLYIGKYLDVNDNFFKKNKAAILKHYQPYLEKFSPDFIDHVTRSWLFKAPFAQPLAFKNHSEKLPTIETAIPGLFWSSMQHVYPWDRGTNYAVRFGRKAAVMAQQYLSIIRE